jgi:hypothetical protein
VKRCERWDLVAVSMKDPTGVACEREATHVAYFEDGEELACCEECVSELEAAGVDVRPLTKRSA